MADSEAPALDIGEADASWALIRDKVVEQRFGPAVVPVPFLEDAARYDLLCVLRRTPGRARGLLGRAGPLVPAGPLEGLAQRGAEAGELAGCTREFGARARGLARYEETRLVGGAPCHIRLQLAGLHKKVAFLALRPGQLALRPDLPWLRAQRSLYLIHEVFCCAGLALAVTRARATRALRLPGPCPLAFRCLKFALGPRGLLGPQKPLGHALPARAAWVKMASLEPTGPAPPAESQAGPQGRGPLPQGRQDREVAVRPAPGAAEHPQTQGPRPALHVAAPAAEPQRRVRQRRLSWARLNPNPNPNPPCNTSQH